MDKVNLVLNTEDVAVSHDRLGIEVKLTAGQSDVLDHFNESEVVAHYDVGKLLDEIGMNACLDHFDLVEAD
ncbi:hypothetical protein ACVTMO_16815 [Pseudomonas segetis]